MGTPIFIDLAVGTADGLNPPDGADVDEALSTPGVCCLPGHRAQG